MGWGVGDDVQMMKMKQTLSMGAVALVLSACAAGTPAPSTSANLQPQIDQLMRLGQRTQAAGDAKTALGFFQKAYSLAPQSRTVLTALAQALRATGDEAAVASLYKAALVDTPDDADLLLSFGTSLLRQDKIVQALVHLERSNDLRAGSLPTLNSLGIAHDLNAAHGTAQNFYRQALALDPDNLDTLNNYALSLALAGQFDQAVTLLQPLAGQVTTPDRLQLNLALIYGLMGQNDQAAEAARVVLDQKSVAHNLEVYKNLRRMTAQKRLKHIITP